jgi:hypothetical protein
MKTTYLKQLVMKIFKNSSKMTTLKTTACEKTASRKLPVKKESCKE